MINKTENAHIILIALILSFPHTFPGEIRAVLVCWYALKCASASAPAPMTLQISDHLCTASLGCFALWIFDGPTHKLLRYLCYMQVINTIYQIFIFHSTVSFLLRWLLLLLLLLLFIILLLVFFIAHKRLIDAREKMLFKYNEMCVCVCVCCRACASECNKIEEFMAHSEKESNTTFVWIWEYRLATAPRAKNSGCI